MVKNPDFKSGMYLKSLHILALLALLCTVVVARPIPASFVVDINTGRVYHAQNADSYVHPASLTKMMTLYMLFEALDKGEIRMDSSIRFSRNAARKPRSNLGVRAGQTLTVKQALTAMVVKSCNDVACAVAERLAGNEERFARIMTRKARSLGMTRTQFKNASGLHHRYQQTTARDMSKLAGALMKNFPRYFEYFKVRTFRHHGRNYGTTNKLLGNVQGVDGIKTGYIAAAGFNLTTSAKYKGRRLVAVVMGGSTGRARDMKMRSLLQRTFRRVDQESQGTLSFIRADGRQAHIEQAFPRLKPTTKLQLALKPVSRKPPVPIRLAKKRIKSASNWQVRMGSLANKSQSLQLAKKMRVALTKALGFQPKVHVGRKTKGKSQPQLFALTEHQARSACRALHSRNVPCVAQSG
ncbi:MAG: serine hydrolase [Alphaproteobacteria bacterium]|nr:MAG: serine hydrolase [Alphaproteobacteria bacterium]